MQSQFRALRQQGHVQKRRTAAAQRLSSNVEEFGGSGGGGSNRKMSFAWSLDGATCTIQPGAIRMHGLAKYPLSSGKDVALTGLTEWVYLKIARNAPSGQELSVFHSSTEPITNSTALRIPVVLLTSTTSGTYAEDHTCQEGDLNLDTPIN